MRLVVISWRSVAVGFTSAQRPWGAAWDKVSKSTWEGDSALYGPYVPDQPRNRGHVNDPKLTAMAQAQRRIKDPEARTQLLADFQRYAAEQQYYVYLFSVMVTSSWQSYLKNYSPNFTFDYGSRIAEAWLDR